MMELEKREIRATPPACGYFETMRDHAALAKARPGNRGCQGEAHPPATMIVAVVDSRDFIAAMQQTTCPPEGSTVVVAGDILSSTPEIRGP